MGGEAPPTFWDRLFTQVLSVLPGAVPPDSRMSPSPNSRIYLSRYITDWLTSLIHCVRYYIHKPWYITQYITHWHYSHHPSLSPAWKHQSDWSTLSRVAAFSDRVKRNIQICPIFHSGTPTYRRPQNYWFELKTQTSKSGRLIWCFRQFFVLFK